MNRNLILLTLSQALMMTVVGLLLSASALVGARLAGSAALATLPLALQYLVTLLALAPASRLMARWGRGPVFMAGAACGGAGLLLAAAGIAFESFSLFCMGAACVGIYGAVGQFYRFAAIEAVPLAQRGRAVALTLSGGVLAAFAGPAIARATRDLLAEPFLASFLALVAGAFLAALLAGALHLPEAVAGRRDAPRRSLRDLLDDAALRLALIGGMVAYGVMNLLMTATPLAMLCARLDFAATAGVIQWHLVAMFAPSFLTGALIGRVGTRAVMALGTVLTLGGIAVALAGTALAHFEGALVLVGVGWNFLYVAATSLLAESWREEDKARVQALNDSLVFGVVSLATFGAGPLVDRLGWESVNLLAALPLIGLLVGVWRWRPRPGGALASRG
ncbi:MAG: MFS transporter [Zoogloea sp.]|nr:MFS transporter [Zoogloea sp.]MCA0188471.1 MFS transporter [Pseudomonadota bacterium]